MQREIDSKKIRNILASCRQPVFIFRSSAMSQLVKSNIADSKSMLFVVDDEPMLLDLVETLLLPLGFDVRTFRDPEMALAEFTSANPRPTVVITDYEMNVPRLTGMDLIRECRQINPHQKIILVSGTVDETIFASAQEKPDFFLAKPYPVQKLVDMIHALIGDANLLAKP
jgi:DNA-binding NtrC family response regulator